MGSVVIDASLLVALFAQEPDSEASESAISSAIKAGTQLHSPDLARYEIASAFSKKTHNGQWRVSDIIAIEEQLNVLPIRYHPIYSITKVVSMAQNLMRKSAYDAAYVALTLQLDATLWTLDGPLARNSIGHGLPVKLIKGDTLEIG